MNSPDSGIPCDSLRWETALNKTQLGIFNKHISRDHCSLYTQSIRIGAPDAQLVRRLPPIFCRT